MNTLDVSSTYLAPFYNPQLLHSFHLKKFFRNNYFEFFLCILSSICGYWLHRRQTVVDLIARSSTTNACDLSNLVKLFVRNQSDSTRYTLSSKSTFEIIAQWTPKVAVSSHLRWGATASSIALFPRMTFSGRIWPVANNPSSTYSQRGDTNTSINR